MLNQLATMAEAGLFENDNTLAMEALATICHKVMCQSFMDVAASPSFLYMPAKMLMSLLKKDNINVSSEDEVTAAVLKWIQHNGRVNNDILEKIFCRLRLCFCSKHFLTEVARDKSHH